MTPRTPRRCAAPPPERPRPGPRGDPGVQLAHALSTAAPQRSGLTLGRAQWYKDVFSGARAAVDAGELGDEMASTFRWLIASEVGGDGIMVTAVMPTGNAKAFEDFYSPKVG